ncbi:MAG: hypothetical protein WA999_12740 [Spirulinaceae cyanobacterium]
MEYITTSQAAKMLRVTQRRVLCLLQQQRIKGAYKKDFAWAIPLYCGKPKVSRGTRGPAPRWAKPRSRAVKMIQVKRQQIKSNSINNEFEAVISVKQNGHKTRQGHELKIQGPCHMIYHRDQKNSQGARLWIETYADVELTDKSNNEEWLIVNF